MAETFHHNTVKRSRKQRQCSWCAEMIEVGEPYTSYQWRDCGDHGYVALHPECLAAMQEVASEEGGWVEFMPGEYNRGCSCGNRREDCECLKPVS
jgi:hypothetical protein